MSTERERWAATSRLRWVWRRVGPDSLPLHERALQQWFAPDVPRYMADEATGEWRDVVTVEGEP